MVKTQSQINPIEIVILATVVSVFAYSSHTLVNAKIDAGPGHDRTPASLSSETGAGSQAESQVVAVSFKCSEDDAPSTYSAAKDSTVRLSGELCGADGAPLAPGVESSGKLRKISVRNETAHADAVAFPDTKTATFTTELIRIAGSAPQMIRVRFDYTDGTHLERKLPIDIK